MDTALLKVGVPREIKDGESRVALTPSAVKRLAAKGGQVYFQKNAGLAAGFLDQEYIKAGAKRVVSSAALWKECDLIVKIKEPQPKEYKFFKSDKILFCFIHLAANKKLARALLKSGITTIAAESVSNKDNHFPMLEPMSEIAGRMAAIVGAYHQMIPSRGRGVLVCGLPGVLPAHVVVVGAGTVGEHAAKIASGLGAQVTILDTRQERLNFLDEILPKNVSTLIATPESLTQTLLSADIIIGAVLIPGAKAPRLITRKMLKNVPKGSILVDVSIDQGGIAETSRPTSHSQPTYIEEGIVHYCVPNMPGAYGRTATAAFTNAILPYLEPLMIQGLIPTFKRDPGFAEGLTTFSGKLVQKMAAESLRLPHTPRTDLIPD